MTNQQAVAEYLRLTDEMAKLRMLRDALKPNFHDGRNFGEDRDVRVSSSSKNTIDMFKLRQMVMPAVIDACMVTRYSSSVTVVEKLKPKKEKKSK